jgi:methionyl-tRNA formyltransferase
MGTPDFAVNALKALAAGEQTEVVLAVTQPDKPVGRHGTLTPPDVKVCAEELGIPVFQPEKVRLPESVEKLRSCKPDLIVVAAFGQILPAEILDMPPLGCINIHASLLPKYRGAAPIQWAILNGDEKAGVTIMKMDVGLDTGDMISSRSIPIGREYTGGTLFDALSNLGAELLMDTIPAIIDGTATYTPQDESAATKVGMIKKSMGEIDFSEDAFAIDRKVRAFDPWPAAYTKYSGKILKIWSCEPYGSLKAAGSENISPEDEGAVSISPGEVIEAGDSLKIACGLGSVLKITSLQLEGKKRMGTADFLRGVRIKEGEILGE